MFSRVPGSAEMPSAARPFTDALVTDLVARGIVIAPVTLHTGVSSLEAGRAARTPSGTGAGRDGRAVNATHADGGRVIAVGTTVVRALETTADARGDRTRGRAGPSSVVTPERGVRVVDGLLTGWHEPEASHLAMLEAVAGRDLLERPTTPRCAEGYRWHEFGDGHLILP